LDQNFEKVDEVIFSTNLPMIVKRKMYDISYMLCYLTKQYILVRNIVGFDERLGRILEGELFSAFEANFFSNYRQRRNQFDLKDNKKIWEAVWKFTEGELSNISKNNAKILVEHLENLYTHFHRQAILDKICNSCFKKNHHPFCYLKCSSFFC
jgi:hypothetical protein